MDFVLGLRQSNLSLYLLLSSTVDAVALQFDAFKTSRNEYYFLSIIVPQIKALRGLHVHD